MVTGETPSIFLAMPLGSEQGHVASLQGFFQLASQRYARLATVRVGSALSHNFNALWSTALGTKEITHFAMLHSDLVPPVWWLDALYDEMQLSGASLVSSVNAIKDRKGLTSTAVGDPEDPWDYRRITTTELQGLPTTFGIEDIPESITEGFRTTLLVNTGCWLADIRDPVWRERDDEGRLKFFFTQNDRISYDDKEDRYVAEFAPEDWLFSRTCAEHGIKVCATTAIKNSHIGSHGYQTGYAWGDLLTDTEAVQFHETKPLSKERLLS